MSFSYFKSVMCLRKYKTGNKERTFIFLYLSDFKRILYLSKSDSEVRAVLHMPLIIFIAVEFYLL
jgi:hypothetical protein